MKTYTYLKTIFVAISAIYFVGCGSQSFTDLASEAPGGNTPIGDVDTNPSQKAYAYCSKDVVGNSEFTARVQAVVTSNNSVIPNYVRVKLPKVPSVDWANNNYDLEVFRWTVSPSGAVLAIDPSTDLLEYQFEKKGTNGFQLISSYKYTRFNWEEMQDMAKYAKQVTELPDNYSPQSFFNDFNMLVDLKDNQGTYKVLRVVIREASDNFSGSVVEELDILLPVFEANPNVYGESRPAILEGLHPLKDKATGGWTESQYQTFANAFCF